MNKSCKACRIGRVRCDVTISADSACARCKRLGLACVLEMRGHGGGGKGHGAPDKAALASARARLSEASRALLVDDPEVPSTALALTAGPDMTDLATMQGNEESVVCKFLVETLSDLNISGDRLMKEQAIRILVLVARQHDHCGLLSYAMQKAQELGFPLSKFASSLDSSSDGELSMKPEETPPAPEALQAMWSDQRYPAVMRTIHNGAPDLISRALPMPRAPGAPKTLLAGFTVPLSASALAFCCSRACTAAAKHPTLPTRATTTDRPSALASARNPAALGRPDLRRA